eukprot:CAMPEP_0184671688 /NCGR_PEP_ID=MMETSP0308-20130426/85649_1 /TAXON_ID=38269 /ORGANISM="Gloeochaete witrockiana, Strain SAG 46.84" /LENGTH=606 /DNA_ID=CAMNT_0027118861 /DNA_START=212 /DNA_END=2032 /DNA_ORIENTATION=-
MIRPVTDQASDGSGAKLQLMTGKDKGKRGEIALDRNVIADNERASNMDTDIAEIIPINPLSNLVAATSERSLFDELPLQSVVKIFTIVTCPNFSMPWQMKRQQKSTSSGFVISGKRILTNAHSVANQTSVMVRKHGSADKYVAKVLAVGHECDLAMLTVEDPLFWETVIPLEFGGIPNLQDAVIVVGYPTGGDNISVTGGVVSRVEIQTYSHASSTLLAIQIDAAINAGNSGGPALKNGKVIGVAFETLVNAENIGYIIPIPVVDHFLTDIQRHGQYTGFCSIGFFWQAMENVQFRKSCKMIAGQTGVYINRVQPLAQAAQNLKKGDVLLNIDGVQVANDGTIPFRKGERIAFRYLITQKFYGETSSLTLLRNGEVIERTVTLGIVRPLVPVHLYDMLPRYFIYAGLVFVPLSQPYLRNEYGKEWETKAPVKLCNLALDGVLTEPDEQVVILSQVLAAEINIGYQLNLANVQLTQFNDLKVRNLRHLMELVEANPETYARFNFENEKVLILDTDLARQANPEILKQHFIPLNKSADLLKPEVLSHIPQQLSSMPDAEVEVHAAASSFESSRDGEHVSKKQKTSAVNGVATIIDLSTENGLVQKAAT